MQSVFRVTVGDFLMNIGKCQLIIHSRGFGHPRLDPKNPMPQWVNSNFSSSFLSSSWPMMRYYMADVVSWVNAKGAPGQHRLDGDKDGIGCE